MSPTHILPLRTVGVVLEVKVIHTVFIEKPVGVVHPSPIRGVMILWAELFAVGGVESGSRFQLFPAAIVLYVPCGTAVGIEAYVQQHLFALVSADVKGDEIVDVVYCQLHVESLCCLIAHHEIDIGIFLFLLNGQQQICRVCRQSVHGVVVA